MQKINFQNLPSTTTPLNATNMNAIQTNVENVFNGSEPMGSIIVDSIRSKNMFNKNMFVGGLNINSSGTYISESASGAGISYIKVEAGKTYTITSNVNRPWYYNFSTSIPTLNGTGTSRTGESGTTRTFTVPSGYTYFCLRSYPSNNEDNINQNIQLEEGSTATSYAPYQELNIEDSGWKDITLLNGTTARDSGVYKPQYRKIGKIVYIKGQVFIPSHNNDLVAFTLPEGYRPSTEIPSLVNEGNSWYDIYGNLLVPPANDLYYQKLNVSYLID